MISFYHLEKHGIIREGLALLAKQHAELSIAGASAGAGEMFALLQRIKVPVVLMDVEPQVVNVKPLEECYRLCQRIYDEHPDTEIVLHSHYQYAAWMNRFIKIGVKGFVSKDSTFAEVVRGIEHAARHQFFVCPIISEQFTHFRTFIRNPSAPQRQGFPAFTEREEKVLELIMQGFSSKQIAALLYLSEKTIETHRRNMVKKMSVKNTVELVSVVTGKGLLSFS